MVSGRKKKRKEERKEETKRGSRVSEVKSEES